MGSSKKVMNEMFNRLRDLETSKASSDSKADSVSEVLKEFMTTFKEHDEKEMAKYDKYDEHLQEVNKTLTKVSVTIDNLSSINDNYKESISLINSNISKKEQEVYKKIEQIQVDTNTELSIITESIKELFKYANRAIGVIIFVAATSSIVWGIFSHFAEERRIMTAKLHKLESNQNRNYDKEELDKFY